MFFLYLSLIIIANLAFFMVKLNCKKAYICIDHLYVTLKYGTVYGID